MVHASGVTYQGMWTNGKPASESCDQPKVMCVYKRGLNMSTHNDFKVLNLQL